MARLARSTNWEQAPVGHIKLFERVYEELLRRILGGDLPAGRRLPAEKDLCELFGVSRPVIRQALLRLRADGLIDSRKGSGSFVANGEVRPEGMVDPRARIADWLKLFEFRFTFEPEAAARAAENAGAERLQAIRVALDMLRDMTAPRGTRQVRRFGLPYRGGRSVRQSVLRPRPDDGSPGNRPLRPSRTLPDAPALRPVPAGARPGRARGHLFRH